LTVRIAGTEYANDWHVWVYPENLSPGPSPQERGAASPQDKPYFTTRFNEAIAKAQAGGNVLFCPPVDALDAEKTGKITVGFTPVFWNTSWFSSQKPNTLGLYCDPSHPALAAFPNDGYSEFQWWDVVKGCAPLLMDDFPPSFRPVVYIIDDWFRPHRLGLLFEAKVGKGKLIVCGADLGSDLNKRPAARQLRRSIEQYMSSDKFCPSQELSPELIKELFRTNL
jgi:hypothetical protein